MKNHCRYTIIGNGRVARHMKFYLQSQNIRLHQWSRSENNLTELSHFIDSCDIVLLLIKDSAIEAFINEQPQLKNKTVVHFSGSLTIPGTVGLHPLMTFSKDLYSLDFYRKIPFVSEKGNKTFKDIFPELENPSTQLEPSQKALYHSLCVMGGNFTTILWSKVFNTFKEKFQIPPEFLYPYLNRITENIKIDHNSALTGPIARRDVRTLQKNLDALNGDAFSQVYESFIQATQPDLLKEIKNDNP